jgi:hypothetical protein
LSGLEPRHPGTQVKYAHFCNQNERKP